MTVARFRSAAAAAAAVAAAACLMALSIGCVSPSRVEKKAPLFDDLGDHHFAVTTSVPLAQRYFDQGLTLSYAFNHAEAARSFREAARHDPGCAMAWWGVALVLGPNINAPMDAGAVPESYAAVRKALELAPKASEKERALIEALSKRYGPEPGADRKALDVAYAEAMRGVARRFPGDDDVLTLLAESLMDLHPWDYWRKDGTAQPWTAEFVKTLESVLARSPGHPGANHLYIHAVEASPDPDRAIPAAERLGPFAPGAGHLVHMPSHIWIRVGRYHDGTVANQNAKAADDSYITQCRAQGLYPLAYRPHNVHFLWACATMEGRSELAMKAACETSMMADEKAMREPGFGALQHYRTVLYHSYVRFGRWDDILSEQPPGADLLYPTAVWHYARGIAHAALGDFAKAEAERKKVAAIMADPKVEAVKIWDHNPAKTVLEIAHETLSAEILARSGKIDGALPHFRKAIEIEDSLIYQEPPDWYPPVRPMMGAALLSAGRPRDAEKAYREDLERHRENGWSLYGLMQSLRDQGRLDEAREMDARFRRAWAHADVTLTASRF